MAEDVRKLGPILVFAAAASSTLHCGWDGLFLTPRSFEATDPARARLIGSAQPLAHVEVLAKSGARIADTDADEAGAFELLLPPDADGLNLRVFARRGASTLKVVVGSTFTGETTDVGRLDATTTARAQLATYEVVQEAGSSFESTPTRALEGLLAKITSAPTAELATFTAVVAEVLESTTRAPGDSVAPFDAAGAELAEAYLMVAGLPAEVSARYRAALGAAAAGYGLEIRCDPSRLNVMFAADLSGRGLDGNGAPQLIRQGAKEGRIFLGFTSDESSAVSDESIPRKLIPNDTRYAMTDDGRNGDEVSADQIFTVVVSLPRGARILYKYTDGAAGEGFTGAEEWPGNARIIEIEDVITGRPDGEPDCLVIRRDSFGDEASNKNFVNLNAKARAAGGTLSFDQDLGGADAPAGAGTVRLGGLTREDIREHASLTPKGVAEARENGVCTVCPAPLVLDPDDTTAPALLRADRLAIDKVRVRFTEPVNAEDARGVERYSYVDSRGQSVRILSATPAGTDVLLATEPADPRDRAKLHVQNIRDASVRENELTAGDINVGIDLTAPKVIAVRALSILDIDPDATVSDPTTGDLVELTLDETPEQSAASDVKRFAIDGLEVLAAVVLDDGAPAATHRIRLVTETQGKSVPYTIAISGLRDAAGNALDQEVSFDGFALYRVSFNVVPGFAFQDAAPESRGIPRGENLYLTGTPLLAARGLDGRDLSISAQGGTRTDVTGWPQFEMRPASDNYLGQPIYTATMLLPPGSWAWKSAHGVEGEYAHPPATLEKVYKTLATANDSTAVRVDPATMIAENGISYAGASLSVTGDEPPRSNIVFKREAPDEVCEVRRDTSCPLILAGTWRDFVLDAGGKTRDYDDGIVTLPPHHPTLPDVSPPKLLDARARDSFSILLSFDETVVRPHQTLDVEVTRADDGFGLAAHVLETAEVKPQQAVLQIDAADCGHALLAREAYTVRYRGARDRADLTDRTWRTQTLLAPAECVPLSPLTDREPPRVTAVEPTDLTELTVRFNERIDPPTASRAQSYAVRTPGGATLAVERVEVLPDRSSVRLTTAAQAILQDYELSLSGISDAADPANTLQSAVVPFRGFGEREAPFVLRARAVASDTVVVRFNEPVEAATAADLSKYRIAGLTLLGAEFSGDPARRGLAFNAVLAPAVRDVVLLRTSPMTAGMAYSLTADGVRDRSGNPANSTVQLLGVSEPPLVDVVLEYEVSQTTTVAGSVPSRAISPAILSDAREGVFVLGARQGTDNAPVSGRSAPVNDVLGGFGVEGQPLDGIEARLADNGALPDRAAGDSVFSILIPRVPLGTTLIWKAFAPYSPAYRDRNPADNAAAFADALPGPSVFADGQEYPGNEDGAVVLDDGSSDGVVRIRALYGDEITYKKHTGGAAYIWVVDDR